jgi:hypothetical protein
MVQAPHCDSLSTAGWGLVQQGKLGLRLLAAARAHCSSKQVGQIFTCCPPPPPPPKTPPPTPPTHHHHLPPPPRAPPHLPLCLVGLLHCRLGLLRQHQLAGLEHLLLPKPHGCSTARHSTQHSTTQHTTTRRSATQQDNVSGVGGSTCSRCRFVLEVGVCEEQVHCSKCVCGNQHLTCT